MEGEGVRQGSLIQVENLIPINVGEEDDVVVRFVSGGVVRRFLGEEALRLATLIDERISGSQLNMTGVDYPGGEQLASDADRILDAAEDVSPCEEESQFFTCPNAEPNVVSSRLADPTVSSEDDLCDEVDKEPRQKRVRRSTECTNSSLDFATAPQNPEADISELAARAAAEVLDVGHEEDNTGEGEVVEEQSGRSSRRQEGKKKLLAIACHPPSRLRRVTTGVLGNAPHGCYRLLAVVLKASLEEDDCSELKMRLSVKDDEGEVSLIAKEAEVELMCRDTLVKQSLSVEQGLAELEGKVADIGVEKSAEGLFVKHSKMI